MDPGRAEELRLQENKDPDQELEKEDNCDGVSGEVECKNTLEVLFMVAEASFFREDSLVRNRKIGVLPQ
jgi:hypothetical protein